MITAFFLSVIVDHVFVTNLAAIFGLIATVGTFIGLYRNKWFKLFAFGLFILFLVGLNNYSVSIRQTSSCFMKN